MEEKDYSPYAPDGATINKPDTGEYSRFMPQSAAPEESEPAGQEDAPQAGEPEDQKQGPDAKQDGQPFKSRFQDEPLALTEAGKGYIKETGKWSRFLGIFMFIAAIALILLGTVMIALCGKAAETSGIASFTIAIYGLLELAIGIVYVFPALYLTRTGKSIRKAFALQDKAELESGLRNVKSYYKFCGVLAIIGIVFFAAALISGIIIGLAAIIGIG